MLRIVFLTIVLCLFSVVRLAAEPAHGEFEVHDVSLWVTDGVTPMANARAGFSSSLPPTVVSQRAPRSADKVLEDSPVGLVTFYGQPSNELDVELKVGKGTFLAHWPTAEGSPNRVRWSRKTGIMLVEKPDADTDLSWVSDDHWIQQARQGDALYVRNARAERFLAYDAEITLSSPVLLHGGPDEYTVANTSDNTVYDIVVVKQTPEGIRVAWLDELPKTDPKQVAAIQASNKPTKKTPMAINLFGLGKPANAEKAATEKEAESPQKDSSDKGVKLFGLAAPKSANDAEEKKATKPAVGLFGLKVPSPEKKKNTAEDSKADQPSAGTKLVLSEPLKPDSEKAIAATMGELAKRLAKTGLSSAEIQLFESRYGKLLFQDQVMVVACRLDAAAIDAAVPLSVFPVPKKFVRVPVVLARNVDPQLSEQIDDLIAQLGVSKYADREAAEEKLVELGPLAVAALKKAAINHKDMEVVIRAERILINQGQTVAGRVGVSEVPAAN